MEATEEQIKSVLVELNDMAYGKKRRYSFVDVLSTEMFGREKTEKIRAQSKDNPSTVSPEEKRRLRIEELKAQVIAYPDGNSVLSEDGKISEAEIQNSEQSQFRLFFSIFGGMIIALLFSVPLGLFKDHTEIFLGGWGLIGFIIFRSLGK